LTWMMGRQKFFCIRCEISENVGSLGKFFNDLEAFDDQNQKFSFTELIEKFLASFKLMWNFFASFLRFTIFCRTSLKVFYIFKPLWNLFSTFFELSQNFFQVFYIR
jgi:hypothetical protein